MLSQKNVAVEHISSIDEQYFFTLHLRNKSPLYGNFLKINKLI